MKGFKITDQAGIVISFSYYIDDAPITSRAFDTLLPFELELFHARVSGQEIWSDSVPKLDIIQENASVFALAGEVVFGPEKPKRTKTANCFGIYYGEGKGLDSCNIFAKVHKDDMDKLIVLGERIWKRGTEKLKFERI